MLDPSCVQSYYLAATAVSTYKWLAQDSMAHIPTSQNQI